METIELTGYIREAYSQIFDEVEMNFGEIANSRRDVVVHLQKNTIVEDGVMYISLDGSSKHERSFMVELLTSAHAGAVVLANMDNDEDALRVLEKYEETVAVYRSTGSWDTSIVDEDEDDMFFEDDDDEVLLRVEANSELADEEVKGETPIVDEDDDDGMFFEDDDDEELEDEVLLRVEANSELADEEVKGEVYEVAADTESEKEDISESAELPIVSENLIEGVSVDEIKEGIDVERITEVVVKKEDAIALNEAVRNLMKNPDVISAIEYYAVTAIEASLHLVRANALKKFHLNIESQPSVKVNFSYVAGAGNNMLSLCTKSDDPNFDFEVTLGLGELLLRKVEFRDGEYGYPVRDREENFYCPSLSNRYEVNIVSFLDRVCAYAAASIASSQLLKEVDEGRVVHEINYRGLQSENGALMDFYIFMLKNTNASEYFYNKKKKDLLGPQQVISSSQDGGEG